MGKFERRDCVVVNKRVGIITEYYNSCNYGGVLQAYALCKVIDNMGCESCQIPYAIKAHKKENLSFIQKFIKYFPIEIFKHAYCSIFNRITNRIIRKRVVKQNSAFTSFRNSIAHENTVYNDKTIKKCVDLYDAIVVGSDQVWKLTQNNLSYLLSFVPEEKVKFSYAASLGDNTLSEVQQQLFRENLKGFAGISVREQDSCKLLQPLTDIAVEWCLDPTLLLSRNEWDEVCAESIIKEKYIFCYYLGNRRKIRQVATKFAKKHDLKIVTVPYLLGRYRGCDAFFGDKRISGVCPEAFISLIKNADYVFTDSFHACVFSLIYKKEFFVFQRTEKGSMRSRIDSLTNIFECSSHFCDDFQMETVEYIESLDKIDYNKTFPRYENLRLNSLEYLKNCLDKIPQGATENEN